ncbi:MAG: tRNA 2-thiouridine(34) synthase MnmA [Candidatus Omnitrophica bacterium]|nr:tRNA 2-thiouridine(34) synthase MnmA [Candidatus Omnitrophota bacterium]
MKNNKGITVYVAMSGGVDSSVAAALIKEAGFNTIGVTMSFNIMRNDCKASCCGIDGIVDAQRAADILAIPHYVFNFEHDINAFIMDNFTDEYLKGRTPNPCVRCNQYLKFGTLYQKVKSLRGDFLATGHYGKIEFNSGRNCHELKKAADPKKDQSYFLYSMKRETLPSVMFPLGGLNKLQVRELARKFNLNTAEKPESQDICFVSAGGYKKFIEDRIGPKSMAPGPFIDENGKVIGQHKGLPNYTIGQRDKLGIALGYPVYVYKMDNTTNSVHIGNLRRLYSGGLRASAMNWVSIEIPQETIEVSAKIRYNSPEVKAYLTPEGTDSVRVEFKQPQKSVTPGQSVVFYDGDVVLGGAVIDEAIELSDEALALVDIKL